MGWLAGSFGGRWAGAAWRCVPGSSPSTTRLTLPDAAACNCPHLLQRLRKGLVLADVGVRHGAARKLHALLKVGLGDAGHCRVVGGVSKEWQGSGAGLGGSGTGQPGAQLLPGQTVGSLHCCTTRPPGSVSSSSMRSGFSCLRRLRSMSCAPRRTGGQAGDADERG